jgi:hypothetical protein
MRFSAIMLAALVIFSASAAAAAKPEATRYLAFQIFMGGFDSDEMRQSIPPPPEDLAETVEDLRDHIRVLPGSPSRQLGFIPGPLSFDNTDEQVTALIASSFDIALKTDMAVGFHLDDSMFWGRLKQLNIPGSIEWLDWSGTPGSGRRLDWSSTPVKIMPQLCLNNKAVTDTVRKRAALIGHDVAEGLKKLHAAGRDELFIGVIAGWETQIGRDFKSGKEIGYCALTNKGFSAQKPPADFESARADIVREFIDLWSKELAKGGVPAGKIYSHAAFMSESLYRLAQRMQPGKLPGSYLETINATPPAVAFGPGHAPGFSTYPQPGHLAQIDAELKKHGNPAWASSEGTAIDPGEAEKGKPGKNMEGYLGNLFNHGARLVNIFGWGVGNRDNPFRKVAEDKESIAAYRKFLRGEKLIETPLPPPEVPSAAWTAKMERLQRDLPAYIAMNGVARVRPLMERIQSQTEALLFVQAEVTADEILKLLDAR